MAQLLQQLLQGVGCAVCLFPSRAEMNQQPFVGAYFANTGSHLQVALKFDGPRMRAEARQLELSLEQKRQDRG